MDLSQTSCVIIPEYMQISGHSVAHLKLIHYMLIVPQQKLYKWNITYCFYHIAKAMHDQNGSIGCAHYLKDFRRGKKRPPKIIKKKKRENIHWPEPRYVLFCSWFFFMYEGRSPPNNLIIFWWQAPCSTGFLHAMSDLETHLYQSTSWCCCERLHLASANRFWRFFNALAHFLVGDLQAHLPTPPEYSAVFDQKGHDPHPLCSSDLALSNFWFPWMKKVLKAETNKQTNSRNTKRH